MIRYLEKKEYSACIPLWQEAFPEDSSQFRDYYFNKKLPGSRVLVKEDCQGRILTMAHLNPYNIKVKGFLWQLSYIVGVATAADSRHQGHMRDVLLRMMRDMNSAGQPFCYLMPASPDIYRPFGFEYIFDQPLWQADRKALRVYEERRLGLEEAPEMLASWMNDWLKARFQVYALRDKSYMEMLQAELDSENGQVSGWFDENGGLMALRAEWGLEKREQRFLYCREDNWALPAASGPSSRPAIMARITDIASMVQPICVNEDCPCGAMEVMIQIKDSLIPENEGLWLWRLEKDGSSLSRAGKHIPVQETAGREARPAVRTAGQELLVSTEVLSATVEQLTSWLFGYRELETVLGEKPPFWCGYIETLKGVFLDEVV